MTRDERSQWLFTRLIRHRQPRWKWLGWKEISRIRFARTNNLDERYRTWGNDEGRRDKQLSRPSHSMHAHRNQWVPSSHQRTRSGITMFFSREPPELWYPVSRMLKNRMRLICISIEWDWRLLYVIVSLCVMWSVFCSVRVTQCALRVYRCFWLMLTLSYLIPELYIRGSIHWDYPLVRWTLKNMSLQLHSG